MKSRTCVLLLILSCTPSLAKDNPVKISTITDQSSAASMDVMKAFIQKIKSHPNLFEIVRNDSPEVGLIYTSDCMERTAASDAFVCFYTAHYVGGTSKTFMGGGIYTAKTADEMADSLLSSFAQDIAERMNSTARDNAIERLESCLYLTQSSCAVPEPLASELKSKTINLSQYLQKGGLKK